MWTDEQRAKAQAYWKGRHHTAETKAKLSAAHCGRKCPPRTAEQKERMRQAALTRWQDPDYRAAAAARMTEELKAKLQAGQYKRGDEWRRRLSQAGKGRHLSVEARLNMSLAQKRRFENPHEREKSRRGRLQQRFPAQMTGCEQALYQELKKRRLRFEMHKTLFERFQPDFVFEEARLIVQVDGDYWHSRAAVVERDYRFNARAVSDGWTVWRFGESKIMSEPVRCAQAIARFVKKPRH